MSNSLIHIGTSGWSYNHWTGIFYPSGLKKSEWLNYYSKEFGTVEINSSFYHLPKDKTFLNWKERTPQEFLFSVKVSRYITHIKRLAECEEALSRLLGAAGNLGKKLGPLLLQMPPNFKKDGQRLKNFLKILPKGYMFAFEFRDESWFSEDIFDLLNKPGCTVVISSSPDFPNIQAVTGSFCYIRLHGSKSLYGSCYTDDELKEVASLINKNIESNIESYIYFNNDAEGYAVENAKTLIKMF